MQLLYADRYAHHLIYAYDYAYRYYMHMTMHIICAYDYFFIRLRISLYVFHMTAHTFFSDGAPSTQVLEKCALQDIHPQMSRPPDSHLWAAISIIK